MTTMPTKSFHIEPGGSLAVILYSLLLSHAYTNPTSRHHVPNPVESGSVLYTGSPSRAKAGGQGTTPGTTPVANTSTVRCASNASATPPMAIYPLHLR